MLLLYRVLLIFAEIMVIFTGAMLSKSDTCFFPDQNIGFTQVLVILYLSALTFRN